MGPAFGALSISCNSSVHFVGHAHRMGGNLGNGSLADIVVANPPQRQDGFAKQSSFITAHAVGSKDRLQAMPRMHAVPAQGLSSYKGFLCDGQAARGDGVYIVTGDVCGCDINCTCQSPTQWMAANCACA
jgi:hypothetical protein